ncbi:unnamed protein product [Arabidopsis lyrata]|uniref:uncharacterized protein LOC110227065 n=1 Tax=Arabidopsis lyrata subsp. lyrata TaxID=81972 RepID=UPI000A29D59F|nr:uncharacterized protein LOC110227065 [Arabidopsis lyrata subsp. lyrata]CAH8270359.1 unnamed protein product [Arabidopsis lyrata]|eukprot:XP_020875847.1 uncharacterized protein LOC110227065 [Arabidopsis lyrata subsp. lyrata]
MAVRSTGHLKNVVQRLRTYTTTATAQGPKPYSTAATEYGGQRTATTTAATKGDFTPVYVSIGLISLSVSFGVYTAYLHLHENPSVRVNKKTRETVPEIEDPDRVLNEADRFANRSWFRKIAHIQEFDKQDVISDPIRKDQFAHKPRAVTLKDVGVDPKMATAH